MAWTFYKTTSRLTSLVLLSHIILTGCAALKPSQPLWDPVRYPTVAVLPAAVVIETGTPPWTTPDAKLSERMATLIQQALSDILSRKGYGVIPPGELNRKLESADLAEHFRLLVSSLALRPGGAVSPKGRTAAVLEGSAPLAQALGADMLVLFDGNGEYYSNFDLAGFESRTFKALRGREEARPPVPFLNIDVRFIDAAGQAQIARIRGHKLDFFDDPGPLTNTLKHALWRVPERTVIP